MSSTPTAENRADKRYPQPKNRASENLATLVDRIAKQMGFATCIREEVEPLEAKLAEQSKALESLSGTLSEHREEIDQLRALVQELVDRLQIERLNYSDIVDMLNIDHGLMHAKSQGFTPTNTTEG